MGKMFYTMGEVAEMFDVNQSLIRHWERQFDVLRPKRNKKGNRLFSPQDVERLKVIYHLVKERGMTLDGARKALRRHRADKGVPRDVELMERLQRIRSMLIEVQEELKGGPVGAYTERMTEVPEEFESDSEVVAEEGAAEEPAVEKVAAEKTVVEKDAAEVAAPAAPEEAAQTASSDVENEQSADSASEAESAQQQQAARPSRKPRRRKDDDDDNELFAFYEQSLF